MKKSKNYLFLAILLLFTPSFSGTEAIGLLVSKYQEQQNRKFLEDDNKHAYKMLKTGSDEVTKFIQKSKYKIPKSFSELDAFKVELAQRVVSLDPELLKENTNSIHLYHYQDEEKKFFLVGKKYFERKPSVFGESPEFQLLFDKAAFQHPKQNASLPLRNRVDIQLKSKNGYTNHPTSVPENGTALQNSTNKLEDTTDNHFVTVAPSDTSTTNHDTSRTNQGSSAITTKKSLIAVGVSIFFALVLYSSYLIYEYSSAKQQHPEGKAAKEEL